MELYQVKMSGDRDQSDPILLTDVESEESAKIRALPITEYIEGAVANGAFKPFTDADGVQRYMNLSTLGTVLEIGEDGNGYAYEDPLVEVENFNALISALRSGTGTVISRQIIEAAVSVQEQKAYTKTLSPGEQFALVFMAKRIQDGQTLEEQGHVHNDLHQPAAYVN